MQKKLLSFVMLFLFVPVLAQNQTSGNKDEDKSPHKSSFVTVNGVKLHYLDWGGEGDALLLLTGFGNNAHVFDDFAPKFTDRFRVFALTRRGWGESDKPAGGYDDATRVEDIRQFLDALKIKRIILIGHSWAGDEMTLFATLYPKRVKKLVYLDAAYDRRDTTALELEDPVIPPLWKRLLLDSIDSPQAAEVVVPKMPPPEEYRIRLAAFKAMNAFRPDYIKIKSPALAFYALPGQHPEITPQTDEEARRKMNLWWQEKVLPYFRKNIELFRKQVRSGQIVEMKDATHYIFLGKTQDEVVRQTRKFLLE